MDIGNVLKLFMIILGVFILIKTVVSLAKRQMTEQFCLVWAVLSVKTEKLSLESSEDNIEE